MRRSVAFLIFSFFMPSLQVFWYWVVAAHANQLCAQVSLFCIAIGRNPEHLPFSVLQQDTGALCKLPVAFAWHPGTEHPFVS